MNRWLASANMQLETSPLEKVELTHLDYLCGNRLKFHGSSDIWPTLEKFAHRYLYTHPQNVFFMSGRKLKYIYFPYDWYIQIDKKLLTGFRKVADALVKSDRLPEAVYIGDVNGLTAETKAEIERMLPGVAIRKLTEKKYDQFLTWSLRHFLEHEFEWPK